MALVLDTLFQAAGLHGEIDPCVAGRVSIAMENVTAAEAFAALGRMADLDIAVDPDTHHLRAGCAEGRVERSPDGAPSGAADLRFVLAREDREGSNEIIARPRLLVPPGQAAEISVGTATPVFDLNREGVPYTRATRPEIRLRVFVVPGGAPYPQRLRGVLELASHDERERPVRTVTGTFDVELPPGTAEITLTRLRFRGKTHELRVSRSGG